MVGNATEPLTAMALQHYSPLTSHQATVPNSLYIYDKPSKQIETHTRTHSHSGAHTPNYTERYRMASFCSLALGGWWSQSMAAKFNTYRISWNSNHTLNCNHPSNCNCPLNCHCTWGGRWLWLCHLPLHRQAQGLHQWQSPVSLEGGGVLETTAAPWSRNRPWIVTTAKLHRKK